MDPNQRGWELLRAPQPTEAQLREALSLFEEALKLRPDDSVPLANLCDALVALGRAEEAVARADQESRSEHRPRAAGAHNWLGWFWKAKPQTNEQAILRLQKAIALRPWWGLPHSNLGHALEAAGRAEEAYFEHGRALRCTDAFDRAFSHERRAAFEARQGWLRNALQSFRLALGLEQLAHGARIDSYREAIGWLEKTLRAAGIGVPPSGLEERDSRWQRERELELPPGWEASNAWGQPLAGAVIEVERLLRAGRWDDAVNQLEQLRTTQPDLLFDAVGYAEKGARLARAAGAGEAGRKMLELALDAYRWFASGASAGGEGLARMIDVERVEDELQKW